MLLRSRKLKGKYKQWKQKKNCQSFQAMLSQTSRRQNLLESVFFRKFKVGKHRKTKAWRKTFCPIEWFVKIRMYQHLFETYVAHRHTSFDFVLPELASALPSLCEKLGVRDERWRTRLGQGHPMPQTFFSLRAMLMFYLFLCCIAALSLDILNDWSNRYRRYVGRRSDAESWRISNLDTSIPEHVEIEMLSFHPCYTLSCWFWIGAWREELQGAQQIQQIQHNTIDTRFFTASWCYPHWFTNSKRCNRLGNKLVDQKYTVKLSPAKGSCMTVLSPYLVLTLSFSPCCFLHRSFIDFLIHSRVFFIE